MVEPQAQQPRDDLRPGVRRRLETRRDERRANVLRNGTELEQPHQNRVELLHLHGPRGVRSDAGGATEHRRQLCELGGRESVVGAKLGRTGRHEPRGDDGLDLVLCPRRPGGKRRGGNREDEQEGGDQERTAHLPSISARSSSPFRVMP